jgi:hypothetical protein
VAVPVLSDRALNRALLARQSLLERSDTPVIDAIDHLVGMQGQAPLAPYVGLWSRLVGFAPADLAAPLESRTLVRATLMRGTVHLVTAEDALRLRPLTEPAITRGFRGGFSGRLTAEQESEVLALGEELLAESPRTRAELRARFGERWPDRDADAMAYAVSYLLPTVQPTPRGIWGRKGRAELTLLTTWLGRPIDEHPSIDEVVLRYLGAFGPASVADAQTWSGLTGLREVFDRLEPGLRRFESEHGQPLYDLPDAPRPDPGTPAPVRFLPEYDNVLFSHHDRRRIIDPGRRVPLPPGLGAQIGTFLVDGRFAGTWRIEGDVLRVVPHCLLADGAADQLEREGQALSVFLGGAGGAVVFDGVGFTR